jgi:hypothetical protein
MEISGPRLFEQLLERSADFLGVQLAEVVEPEEEGEHRFGNVSSTAGGVSERNSDLSDPDIESIKQVDIHGDATVPPVVVDDQ